MPDRSLPSSNRGDSGCLPNSHGFTDFQKFSTCSATWRRATSTARPSRHSSALGNAAPGEESAYLLVLLRSEFEGVCVAVRKDGGPPAC